MNHHINPIHRNKQMDNVKTVLVVDDSRVSRLMSRQFILSRHPLWQIEEAASGEEALEKVRNLTPFLVLMDVNMPGMGGMAAAEQIHTLHPSSHISMLTANVQDATRNRAVALGLGFLEKPITESRIHQLLASLGH
jgi:two-component system, chemotaxis family, chemotaxis protein CheY